MNPSFSRLQKRILTACVIIYTMAYLNRLNLSAALASLREVLSISAAQAGLLQTFFAVVYAVGQFINGALVDRLNPVRHMEIGIIGSAICNLLMGCFASYPVLLILCLLNGACQSMLWTPIVRLFAEYYENFQLRKRANLIQSLSLVVGHLGAWAISGYLSSILSWRLSFIVPAAATVPAFLVAWYLLRNLKTSEVSSDSGADSRTVSRPPVFRLFVRTGFLLILLVSIFHGFIKDGVVTWAPDILRSVGNGGLSSTTFSLIIPVINALGILGGYWLQQKAGKDNRTMISVIMLLSGVCCIPLVLHHCSLFPTALFLGLVCSCMYGLNPILTGLVPMEYDLSGCTGLTAGFIDSFIYLGSSLAGVLAGGIYESSGARALYLVFLIASVLGCGICFLSGLQAKNSPYLTDAHKS